MRPAAEVTREIANCGTRIAGLLALILAFCALSLHAQPVPKINAVSPEWVQRGATTEFTLTGENLSAVNGFIFSGASGLSATNLPPPTAPAPKISIESASGGITPTEAAPVKDDKRLVIKITAAPDARVGSRELRLIAPGGVSNPVNINVGYLPELSEREPDNSLEQAQPITFPVSISGVISAAAQIDYYKFKGSKGLELIFDVDAFRRGSPLDSTLAILDGSGKELVRSEDVNGFDSFIAFTVPADGDYYAQIRDFRFQGSGAHKYRINAGELPWVDTVFPFGGQRGKAVEVALSGHNLEGTTKMTFNIAPMSSLGNQEIRANTPKGYSNPIAFHVSDLPDTLEAEPNDTGDKANPISVPVIVNGRIGSEKDVDRFRFKAPADQKLVCEAIANRYGSPLDALLILEDAKGAVLQQNDDVSGTDARIEFDAKKDTEYVIAIRDLTGRGGANFSYRLAIRPPSAAAEANFTVRFSPDAVRIPRGGITRVRCELSRAGYDGPVRIAFQDLPNGVFGEAIVLTGTPSSGLVTLSATAAAPLGSFPLKLTGTALVGGKSVTRIGEGLLGDKPVRESFLTVLENAPFTIDPITLSQDIEQNRSGTIEVMVQRREGFSGEVRLTAEGYAAGKDGIGKSLSVGDTTVKAGEMLGKIKLTARQDSEIGTRTIIIRGEATADGQNVVQYSREIPVRITQIPFVLSSTLPKLTVTALAAGSQSAAGESSTVIKVERRDGFTNEVQLSAKGIPDGVLLTLDKIAANAGETTLKIVATDKAKPGTNYSIALTGVGVHQDRTYRFKPGAIALVVNAPEMSEQPVPPPALATNAAAADGVRPSPGAATDKGESAAKDLKRAAASASSPPKDSGPPAAAVAAKSAATTSPAPATAAK